MFVFTAGGEWGFSIQFLFILHNLVFPNTILRMSMFDLHTSSRVKCYNKKYTYNNVEMQCI